VRTGPTCEWRADSGASWIMIESGRSGRGDGEVAYRVAVNTSTDPRSATLTIGNRPFRVEQEGARRNPPDDDDDDDDEDDDDDDDNGNGNGGRDGRAEGRVGSLSGSCPSLSFSVGGQSVVTDGSTEFKGGNCRDLRNGVEVKVRGERRGSGPIRAERVDIDD
jgi:hypothetical protein